MSSQDERVRIHKKILDHILGWGPWLYLLVYSSSSSYIDTMYVSLQCTVCYAKVCLEFLAVLTVFLSPSLSCDGQHHSSLPGFISLLSTDQSQWLFTFIYFWSNWENLEGCLYNEKSYKHVLFLQDLWLKFTYLASPYVIFKFKSCFKKKTI